MGKTTYPPQVGTCKLGGQMASRSLSQRDLSAVLEAAESILEASSLEVLRQRTVELVPSLVQSNVVSWNEVNLRGGPNLMVPSASPVVPTEPEKVAEYTNAFQNYVHEHPVIAYYQQTRDGRPYAISDFLSAAEFHGTNLYQLLYRYLFTEDQISFVLPDPRLVIGVAISRDRRGFAERDRDICSLLRMYLVQAYRNIDALARVQHLLATVHQLADDHGEAALILDHTGSPDQVSRQTHQLLRKYFGEHDPLTLPAPIYDWLQSQPPDFAAPSTIFRGNGRSLVVRRVLDGDRDILFLFEKDDDSSRADGHQLGLTPREAEVLELLAGGLTTKRIAATLSISPRTVDKHVATILDKLSVRTRLEAVSLLANPRR